MEKKPPPPSSKKTQSFKNSNFIDTIKEGLGIGMGISLGKNLIDKAIEKINIPIQQTENNKKCEDFIKEYDNCLKYDKQNNCEYILNNFRECILKKV